MFSLSWLTPELIQAITKQKQEEAAMPSVNQMRVSAKGVIELISHEAIVLNSYHDTKGVWTFGVGVTDSAGFKLKPSTFPFLES